MFSMLFYYLMRPSYVRPVSLPTSVHGAVRVVLRMSSVQRPSLFLLVTDPPPAEAVILTHDYVVKKIEELLVEEKYTKLLELAVDDVDQDKLREAEDRRKKKEYVPPTSETVTKLVGKSKTKKKGNDI